MSAATPRQYLEPLLGELPRLARWYIVSVIVAGAVTFDVLAPRATLTPLTPLVLLVLLSSLTFGSRSNSLRPSCGHERQRHRTGDRRADPLRLFEPYFRPRGKAKERTSAPGGRAVGH